MQQLGLQEMDGMNAEMHAEDMAGGNPLQSLANKVSPIKSQRGRSQNKGKGSASGSKSKSPSKSNKSSPNQKKQEMQSRRAAAKKFAEELKTGMHR